MSVHDREFICGICERPITPERFGYDRRFHTMPPICRSCEQPSYVSWHGRGRAMGVVKNGAFGDRRMARRLFAAANALEATANRMIWEGARG